MFVRLCFNSQRGVYATTIDLLL